MSVLHKLHRKSAIRVTQCLFTFYVKINDNDDAFFSFMLNIYKNIQNCYDRVEANVKPVRGRPRKTVIVPSFGKNLPSIAPPNIHDLDKSTIFMTVDMPNQPIYVSYCHI